MECWREFIRYLQKATLSNLWDQCDHVMIFGNFFISLIILNFCFTLSWLMNLQPSKLLRQVLCVKIKRLPVFTFCHFPFHHSWTQFHCLDIDGEKHLHLSIAFTPLHRYAYSPYCSYTFSKLLTRRICLTIKSILKWSFHLFSWPFSFDSVVIL